MYKKTIVYAGVMVLLASVLAACSGIAFAQAETPTGQSDEAKPVTRTMSVSGNGKVYLTPDIAYVNIGVHTENKDAAKAVADNSIQSQKVVNAVEAMGVDEKDIQTTNFSIYPRQEYDDQGKLTGEITYIVDNSVFVTVRDLDKIGEILDEAVKGGANSISGIQFDVADNSKAVSEAREAAVKSAQVKAEELAKAAGVTLGEIQTINEYSGAPPVPISESKVGVRMMADMVEAEVPVSPGQMTVTVDVNVIYEIR